MSRPLANACHDFTWFYLPWDQPAYWLGLFVELMKGNRRKDSKLENLASRARFLDHRSSQDIVTDLLCFIGRASQYLPALRTVELWDASDGFGCLFRCTIGSCRVTITWRCTDLRFNLEEKVVQQRAQWAPNHELKVQHIPLTMSMESNKRFKHSTILPALHLRQLSFDPICERKVVVAKTMKVRCPP